MILGVLFALELRQWQINQSVDVGLARKILLCVLFCSYQFRAVSGAYDRRVMVNCTLELQIL